MAEKNDQHDADHGHDDDQEPVPTDPGVLRPLERFATPVGPSEPVIAVEDAAV